MPSSIYWNGFLEPTQRNIEKPIFVQNSKGCAVFILLSFLNDGSDFNELGCEEWIWEILQSVTFFPLFGLFIWFGLIVHSTVGPELPFWHLKWYNTTSEARFVAMVKNWNNDMGLELVLICLYQTNTIRSPKISRNLTLVFKPTRDVRPFP